MIKFTETAETLECDVFGYSSDGRSCLEIRVPNTTYEAMKAKFADNTAFSTVDDSGNLYDQSAYCKLIEIRDKLDGNIHIIMGKKTETELLQEQLAALQAQINAANEGV